MYCSRSSEGYAQNLHTLSVHSMHIAEIVRIVSYTQQTLPVCFQIWNNMIGRKYCKCNKRSNKNWIVNYALQHWDMQFDSSLWYKIRSYVTLPMQLHITTTTTTICKLACISVYAVKQNLCGYIWIIARKWKTTQSFTNVNSTVMIVKS